MIRLRLLITSAFSLVLAAPDVQAQANLSTQGLGYAAGQLSARGRMTGGALGESDPASAINPAALLNWAGSVLYFQVEPEYRSVAIGGTQDRTNVARYPLAAGALSLGTRWMLAVTSSTLLDRTWATADSTVNLVDGVPVRSLTRLGSQGGINDLRLGVAYAPRPWLLLGVGAHAYTGRHQITTLRTFDTTSALATFQDTTFSSYGGNAFSAGFEARAGQYASIAGSWRRGTGISVQTEGASRSARIPDRLGLSVSYIGIANATIAARVSHETWSALDGLSTGRSRPQDAWDFGLGAEAAGPSIGGRVMQLRAGARQRSLPFDILGERVRERSISAGAGSVLGRGRALVDAGVVRSFRDALGGPAAMASEDAWTFSLALTVRP